MATVPGTIVKFSGLVSQFNWSPLVLTKSPSSPVRISHHSIEMYRFGLVAMARNGSNGTKPNRTERTAEQIDLLTQTPKVFTQLEWKHCTVQ